LTVFLRRQLTILPVVVFSGLVELGDMWLDASEGFIITFSEKERLDEPKQFVALMVHVPVSCCLTIRTIKQSPFVM
jgi:hypothetical protein